MAFTSSARRPKSAERIDGAIFIVVSKTLVHPSHVLLARIEPEEVADVGELVQPDPRNGGVHVEAFGTGGSDLVLEGLQVRGVVQEHRAVADVSVTRHDALHAFER